MSRFQKLKDFFTRNKPSISTTVKKPNKPKKNSQGHDATIHKLRDMEEMLGKKQEYLEKLIEKEVGIARQNGLKNKRVAIQALKRKRRYEQQLLQIDGTLTTLEMQRDNLEGTDRNMAVLQTMQSASAAMKEAQRHLDVDKVHDILDDIAEQQDLAKEISDAVASPLRFYEDVDEDELEKELAELETQDITEELLKIDSVAPLIDFPENNTSEKPDSGIASASFLSDNHEERFHNRVSRHGHKKIENEEDKELKELAAWAS